MNTPTATLLHYSDRSKRAPSAYVRLGVAATYMLSEPAEFWSLDQRTGDYIKRKTRFVWVSTSCVDGTWETYIFPAYRSGKVHHWGEMPGSQKCETDHEVVLNELGYNVAHSVARHNTGKRK